MTNRDCCKTQVLQQSLRLSLFSIADYQQNQADEAGDGGDDTDSEPGIFHHGADPIRTAVIDYTAGRHCTTCCDQERKNDADGADGC